MYRNSLVVQWLGLSTFNGMVTGSIPGWGNRMLQATRSGPKKPNPKSTDMCVHYVQFLGSPVPISLAKFSHLRCFQSPFRVFPPELVLGCGFSGEKARP